MIRRRLAIVGAGVVGVVVGLLFVQACNVEVPPLECTNDGHCGVGQACIQARCIAQPEDAAGEADSARDAPTGEDPDQDEGGTTWPNDPAPGQDSPQAYRCEEGPRATFPNHVLIRTQATDHHVFSGTVTDADGNGIWYVRDSDGREQRGTVVTDSLTGDFEAVVPTWCNDSLVKLVWENAACAYVAVFSIQTTTCIQPDLRVSLFWNPDGDNLDLHLVRPGGRLNNGDDDCNSRNCTFEPPDWGETGTVGDPIKNLDAISGGGPEIILLSKPENGIYHVFVERISELAGPPSDATVIVTVNGRPTAGQVLRIRNHHVWEVASVSWPGGTVIPSTTVHDCTDEWQEEGCGLPLPE